MKKLILKCLFIICVIVIYTLQATAQLEFEEHVISDTYEGVFNISSCDVDSDGDIDILTSAWTSDAMVWWENDGELNFTLHTITDDFLDVRCIEGADLDGDGDNDIIAVGYADDALKWWENDGEENFTDHTIDGNWTSPENFDIADFDGDEDLDIVLAWLGSDRIILYENDGNAEYTPYIVTSAFNDANCAKFVDLDSDGNMDIVGTSSSDNEVAWWENQGDYEFTFHSIHDAAYAPKMAHTADLDNDGDWDIVSASYTYSDIIWYENDGDEVFSINSVADSAHSTYWLDVGDINNDGYLDVVGCTSNADVTWYENNDAQEFEDYLINDSDGGIYCIKLVDLDNDTDLDVIVANYTLNLVVWYENLMPQPELTEFHLLGPDSASVFDSTQIELSWQSSRNPVAEDTIEYFISISLDAPDNYTIYYSTLDTSYLFPGEYGTIYYWDIYAVSNNYDLDRWAEEEDWFFVIDEEDAVDDSGLKSLPSEFAIHSVYPNPFNASTNIVVALPQPTFLSLEIFNIHGRKVATLSERQVKDGYYNINFNADNLTSGIYFVQASVPDRMKEFQKIVLIK